MWFMMCTGYVFILALREAGFNWLIIFSLSGYLALLLTLLVCLYLFAIFRGASSAAIMQKEHPLTSTSFYMAFYVSAPLIGAVASVPAILELSETSQLFGLIALSTFGTTFLTWVIVDPVISLIETLTPAARASRHVRLAEAKAQREEQQQDCARKVEEVLQKQEQLKQQWESNLKSKAEELAELLVGSQTGIKNAEQKAIDIGVGAWQMGGLDCMRKLHKMALEQSKANRQNMVVVDYLKNWWDGIGTWRIPAAG